MTDLLAIRAEAARIALTLEEGERDCHIDTPGDHLEAALDRCIESQGWQVTIWPHALTVTVPGWKSATTYTPASAATIPGRLAQTLRHLCTLTTGLESANVEG